MSDNDSSVFGEATDQLTVTATLPEPPPEKYARITRRDIVYILLFVAAVAAVVAAFVYFNASFPDCISNCQHP